MDWIQLISAAGLGAIIATITQSWLAERAAIKQRNFQEKKDAYVGILNAMHRSEIEQTSEAALYVGHWSNICEIVGSKTVRDCLKRYMESNPVEGKVHPDRPQVMGDLKEAMRKDLGFPLN